MVEIHMRSTEETREEQFQRDPAFRASWERTALARAVALSVIGYRVEYHLTQAKLAAKLGVPPAQVSRLELGERTPSLEMLQRLVQRLGLRFIIDLAPAGAATTASSLTLPAGVSVVEDVTADGARLLVAAG